MIGEDLIGFPDDEVSAPYTCIRCYQSTWNDYDICDECQEEALDSQTI